MSDFIKINLAACAAERANQYAADFQRFSDEYDTVQLWKRHRVYQTNCSGHPVGWMTPV